MTNPSLFALVALTLSAPAAMARADLMSGAYLCGGGVRIPAVFVNPPYGEAYAVAVIDGSLVAMRATVSASGARYRSGDGPDAWQLWAKGDRAAISQGADGRDEARFVDCLWQP